MNIPGKEDCSEFALQVVQTATNCDTSKTGLLLIRPVLEAIYKRLSSDSNMSFSGLFARMQYVHDACSFPEWLVRQVNTFRILCNKAAHEEDCVCDTTELHSAVYVIWKLLCHIQPDAGYLPIENYCLENKAVPFPDLPTSKKVSFQCVVQSFSSVEQNKAGSSLEISAINEDGDRISIQMRDSAEKGDGRIWSRLGRSLWRYSVLACYNLSPVAGRQNFYQNNPSSMLVLEPDFLIDASSIADCFSNQGSHPELYVINRVISESGSDSMMKGSITNDIFDNLILNPDSEYDEMFRNSLAKHPMSMIALGKKTALDAHDSIRESHLPQLHSVANTMRGTSFQLEPTFICPRFGLQGRLDLLYTKDGKQYIVELKSGKPPHWDVWPQHKMQVTAYNMIIRNCYGNENVGTSSILYSADGENTLRHVVNTIAAEQELLMCRNRIVGIMHSLSENPQMFFDWVRKKEPNTLQGFTLDRYNKLKELLCGLEPYEYDWFLEQVKLTVREAWFAKTGSNGLRDDGIYGYNALWQQSRDDKIRHYKIITGLKSISATSNELRFVSDENGEITDFRQGDIVVLYREGIPVDRQEILRGSIIELDEHRVVVKVRGGMRRELELQTTHTWSLEHDMLESTLLSPLNSIRFFLEGPSATRTKILGLLRPDHTAYEHSDDYIEDLVLRISAAQDYFVVQGPPGTGKTSGLITSFIKKLYHTSEQTILVLSFTNRAVDEICLNLGKHGVQYIRTGSSAVIDDRLMENLISGQKFDDIERVVRENRVWVSTVQSCNAWIDDFLRICGQVDTLVIDEASQIIENTILGVVSRAGRTILIGDQNQLPPIVVQGNARYEFTRGELLALEYSTFNRSLMERLWRVACRNGWNDAFEMLHYHYRMHNDIVALIQDNYSGKLMSRSERQSSPLSEADLAHPVFCSRTVWIDCPPSDSVYYDDLQVELTLTLLKEYHLLHPETDYAEAIGIVSPYRAMIHALRKKLSEPFDTITIDTVERFQGSERDNIIIVLPLHNAAALRTMEAVSDDGMIDRKLNVALSRARERVVILGNSLICRSAPHYSALLDRIHSSGKVIPADQLIKSFTKGE